MMRRSAGFTLLEVVIVAAVVIALGAAAIVTYNRAQAPATTLSPTPLPAIDQVNLPDVHSLDDFDAAARALDQVNLDASDTDAARLDIETSGF